MPKTYTTEFDVAQPSGAVALLQFHAEGSGVLVSAVVRPERAASVCDERWAEIHVTDSKGVYIDHVSLVPDDAVGELQVPLALLRTDNADKFRVVLVVPPSYGSAVRGSLTAVHGLDADTNRRIAGAIYTPLGPKQVTPIVSVAAEQDACDIPVCLRPYITPLYRRGRKADYIPIVPTDAQCPSTGGWQTLR